MTNPMVRVVLCAAIAVSLNVHAAVANPSTHGRDGFAQILVAAPQSAGIQTNRPNQRLEISKRRSNTTYSACVLLTAGGPAADRGHIGIVLQNGERPPFFPAGRPSGRSPPKRIS